MNNIGFGIFCFGDKQYFIKTIEKFHLLTDNGYCPFILTDNFEYFDNSIPLTHLILYNRTVKSYHDKLQLIKIILKYHDIAILIDADANITNSSFLYDIKSYNFKKGITYIDTLINHPCKKQFVKDLNMSTAEWLEYKKYGNSIINNFENIELIWEYFMVFNKDGFNLEKFFIEYEKLQIVKEFCDLPTDKTIMAPGEGISITIASYLSKTNLQKDDVLYDIIKNSITAVNKRYLINQ